MSWRTLLLLVVACLGGCARQTVRPAAPVAGASAPALGAVGPGQCRVGADGGIPVADRGIGGTGQVADRGIGGTGAPPVGQTGIVGVITGFASVCLAGEEVQYGPNLPVVVDGQAAGIGTLRAGQVAVVQAMGLNATSLAVRHEVSGPLERVEAGGALRVGGQRVVPPPGTVAFAPGSWLLVSGFRLVDGTIVATRLDLRGPGETLVRGIMQNDRGHLYIGLLEIRPGRNQFRRPGVPVVAVGRWIDGVLEADTVEPDGLLVDPEAYFGAGVTTLVLEGYAEGGTLRFGGRLRFGGALADGRAFTRLDRGAGGEFVPAFIRRSGPEFGGARSGFGPAPVPNRAVGGGGGGQFGARGGGQGRGLAARRQGDVEGGGQSGGGQSGGGQGGSGGGQASSGYGGQQGFERPQGFGGGGFQRGR